MSKPSKTKHLIAFILIILISSLGVFALGIEETKAGPCNPFSGFEGGTCAMSIGLGVLNTVITFFGSALNIALNLLKQLLNWGEFIEADIVKTGWEITRDLANMFFVLILMAIAFATILRIETYGMKALLPKLIIAALLINFSLVIAGVVIDFAQVITDFFLSQAGGDDFHANMMNATQATRALATRGDVSLGTGMTAMGHIFMGALITVIFLLLICFVFAAYALLLIIRMVIIWFLLILSPIVWMFWILPATQSYFSKWWNTFIKWCFFAPASAFFLYLAIFSYKSLLTANIVTALKAEDYSKLLPALTQPENLLNYALVMGILLGGLIAAQQMGIAGASGAIGIAKGAGRRIQGAAKGAGIGMAKWTGKKAQQKLLAPASRLLQKSIPGLGWARIPGIKQAARPFRAMTERERAAMAETEKKYKDRTSDNLKAGYSAVDTRSKAAFAKILAERGDLEENKRLGFTEKHIKQATNIAKRYEQHRPILKARPDLAGDYEEIEKTISKMSPKDMEKIQSKSLENDNVKIAIRVQLTEKASAEHPNRGQWQSQYLSKLADLNPKTFIKVKEEIINKDIIPNFEQIETERPDITAYLNSDAGKAIFGEPISSQATPSKPEVETPKEETKKEEETKSEFTEEDRSFI